MSLAPEIFLIAFFSIPEIIGGAIIARAFQQLRRGIDVNSILRLFWGGLFGIIPLVIGWDVFAQIEMSFLIIAQIAVLVGAILVVSFLPTDYFEEFKSNNVFMLAVGGLFLLIGLGVAAVLLRNGEPVGWLVMLLSGGAGGVVLFLGLRGLLREK